MRVAQNRSAPSPSRALMYSISFSQDRSARRLPRPDLLGRPRGLVVAPLEMPAPISVSIPTTVVIVLLPDSS